MRDAVINHLPELILGAFVSAIVTVVLDFTENQIFESFKAIFFEQADSVADSFPLCAFLIKLIWLILTIGTMSIPFAVVINVLLSLTSYRV